MGQVGFKGIKVMAVRKEPSKHVNKTSGQYKLQQYSEDVSGEVNTLRTGDADWCFYITTVQDG